MVTARHAGDGIPGAAVEPGHQRHARARRRSRSTFGGMLGSELGPSGEIAGQKVSVRPAADLGEMVAICTWPPANRSTRSATLPRVAFDWGLRARRNGSVGRHLATWRGAGRPERRSRGRRDVRGFPRRPARPQVATTAASPATHPTPHHPNRRSLRRPLRWRPDSSQGPARRKARRPGYPGFPQ